MKLTIRARLTLVYGGLFFLAGVVLLAVTYALMSQQLPRGEMQSYAGEGQPLPAPPQAPPPQHTTITGDRISPEEALTALLTQGGIALVVVGVAATALGWLIAGRMLQPLARVTETARRIADAPDADRGLHERIALTGPPDEIKRLGDTFDVMLERLDHSFDGQRRFIVNASHELRTPLTLNRTLLEVAVRRPDAAPEVRQLGDTLLEINSRHERLIDGLLLLARSERELVEKSYVDIGDIVAHVVDTQPADAVTLDAAPGEAPTHGNAVLLERLVQNLVENGVRYNVPGGWVRVASSTVSGTAVLLVTNTGPAVPHYEIPGLFEPFRRLADERLAAPGAGLGLSIVRAVARAHGGEVTAEPRAGGGLVVTVVLPGEAEPGHNMMNGRASQATPMPAPNP